MLSQRAKVLLLGLLVAGFGPAYPDARAETATAAEPELKTLEFFLEGFRIRKKHISMEGPQEKKPIKSALPKSDSTVWVRSMAVEMLDENREPISSEFLCHAWLTFQSPESGGMLSVSQGTEVVMLPEGFAFPVPNTAESRVMLIGMVENNNYDVIDQKAIMKYTIGYYSDEEAREFEIKGLKALNMVARPDAPAVHPKQPIMQGLNAHHWLVPPGRHTYTSSIVRPQFQTPGNPLGIGDNTRIHYMRVHLHGYGESVSLVDKTTGEKLWTGYAKNSETIRHLLHSDFYSDVEGIPLHRDHQYELEVVYNNPTSEPVDAMGAFRAYVTGDLAARRIRPGSPRSHH